MTTKTEMTLENVCFRYDGSKEAKECFGAFRDATKCLWSPQDGMIYGIVDNKPKIDFVVPIGFTEVSPSDYLLILSAPESQAHLLREKDLIVGNRFECIETFHDGRINYIEGCIYPCNRDGGISDHRGYHIKITTDFLNRHFKLASQPPVMEGREETLQDVIKRVSPFGTMTISNPKMLIALEDFIGQKTSSLQSEVEQLKGALQELVDIQNGPPLEQHKKEWQEIIEKCYSILSK